MARTEVVDFAVLRTKKYLVRVLIFFTARTLYVTEDGWLWADSSPCGSAIAVPCVSKVPRGLTFTYPVTPLAGAEARERSPAAASILLHHQGIYPSSRRIA